ncbi:MAG: ParA family protein [Desulfatitalea sp.]|nr:AAA family ATPase [Desulfatitalea sp.]NNK00077.1 ParA family protein [Desulfatitalea sp.]
MQTHTIAIANEKGGVGKTVTVINLAAALNRLNRKVLVVDMDPQANATKGLGVSVEAGQPNIYGLLSDPDAADAHQAIVSTAWEGLDVIPSHTDLSGAEVELTNEHGRENRLKEALADLPDAYDVVLIDTPPSLSLLTVNVFTYARFVLVPCQTHPYAYGALQALFDTIGAVKDAINPDITVLGILATFYDHRTRVARSILDRLKNEAAYRDLLFKTVIRTNTAIAESADKGRPVVFYRRSSFGAIDYTQFAEEMMARLD